jgi:regulator of cell morphogenesis and NO signaling
LINTIDTTATSASMVNEHHEVKPETTDHGVTEWSRLGPVALVDHLEAAHHQYLWRELSCISALIAEVVSTHGRRQPEISEVTTRFEDATFDLERHLLKQERQVFPMIRGLVSRGVEPMDWHRSMDGSVSVFLREHDSIGEVLATVGRLAIHNRPHADGCSTCTACEAARGEPEADTHLHINRENNILFPMVVTLERAMRAEDGIPVRWNSAPPW